MRNVRLWRGLLGVDKRTVIEDIEFDQEGADGVQLVVARVRPRSGVSRRCGRCGRRAPWYDRGEGRRRWRGLDWGTMQVVLEADAPRVNCPAHGPTVVAVPWARHHAGHTLGFDDTVAWLAVLSRLAGVIFFVLFQSSEYHMLGYFDLVFFIPELTLLMAL